MFNRTVLSILGILSLAWIGYVAIHLISSSITPSPSHVFSEKDEQIVVIHQVDEIDYSHPNMAFLQKVPFFQQVLSQTERIQHYYFSSNRHIAVLERSKPWTIELIEKYFEHFGYGVNLKNAKEIHISNGWKGKYHDNFLVIYENPWIPNEEKIIDWKYIDRKSSASFIQKTARGYSIENSYFISKNKVKYISQTGWKGLPLADDQELFQEIIPADFGTYLFYETHYLKKISPKPSPVFEWLNYGLALIETDNDTCVVTDFTPGQDPIAILSSFISEENGFSTEKKASIRNCPLPLDILHTSDWEIEVFNNLAFIARKRTTIDKLLGAYETGNTLAQVSQKVTLLFEATPKKVSYRKLTPQEHITKSFLNRSVHTVIQTLNHSENESGEETVQQLEPIRLDGTVAHLIPVQGTRQLYVITDANTLSLISNQTQSWSKEISGTVIGEPFLLPNSSQLVITTSTGIFIYDTGGNIQNGTPIALSNVKSGASVFVWKGEHQLAVIAGSNLHIFKTDGKKVASQTIQVSGNSELALMIQGVKGELIVNYIDNGTWYRYNLKRKRKLNSFSVGNGTWFLVKANNTMGAIGLSKKQLIRYSEKGERSVLIGNVGNLLRHSLSQDQDLFYLSQQQHVYVINGTGNVVAQFDTRVTRIEDAYLLKTVSGKTLVGILDGISNNSYIYTLNGNELGKQSFEGSGKLVLHRQGDNSILLVSQSNTYLVRYTLNF